MSELETWDGEPIDPRTERLIWRGLGRKSAKQMSDETGLPATEILRLKTAMLEGVDELNLQQRRMKLMADLQDVSDKARDLAEVSIQEFQSGLLNSSVAAMKTILTELSRMEKSDTSKVEALNELRVRELTSLMMEVVDTTVPLVAERYGLDAEDLFEMFNESLARAAARRDAM